MTSQIKSEAGLTLIELLLALAISTLIMGVVFGALLNTFRTYQKSSEHIDVRQEANLIVTKLATIHYGQSKAYTISFIDATEIQVETEDGIETIGNDRFNYQFRINNGILSADNTTVIIPKGKNLDLSVTVKPIHAPTQQFTVSTIISRIGGN